MFGMNMKVIGKDIVDAKLLMAAPRILEHNRLLIDVMLDQVKERTRDQTPLGPGHFGYHLRDMYITDVKSHGTKSIGVLKSPSTGFWRERGTRRGERRFWTAHKALNAVRYVIRQFYGGQAAWWRL